MEKFIFLVILLVAFGCSHTKGEISFTSHVYRNYVSVTCSRTGVSANYRNFISILITKSAGDSGTYVASQSSYKTTNNFTGSVINSSASNSLSLMWDQFYFNVDGTYTCIVYYLAEDNTARLESEQITVKLKDLDPAIATTPKHIQDGLTKSLVVECSSVNFGLHDITLPAQIELFHSYDGTEQRIASAVTIASANASDMTNDSYIFKATPENGWDIVSSNVPKGQALSLAVIRELPTTRESGTYKCILSGTSNESVSTVQTMSTAQVTASVATKQDIYDRVGEEDRQGYYLFTCNFENGLCGFDLPEPSSYPGWQHVQSRLVGDAEDHTLRNESGHYLRVHVPERSYSVATVKSKKFSAPGRRLCISFWYHVSGYNAELSVYITQNYTVNYFQTRASYGWIYKEISLPEISGDFTVDIKFSNYYYYYYNTEGTALFDDFVVSDINCNGSY